MSDCHAIENRLITIIVMNELSVDLAILFGLRSLMGERFAELLKSYLSSYEESLENLRLAILDGNVIWQHHLVHELKPTSAMVGANKMAYMAEILEKIKIIGGISAPLTEQESLLEEFQSVKSNLTELLKNSEAAG